MNIITVNTIALYGSHVRGDNDFISDRDILLVDNDIHVLTHAIEHFTSRGYSCSAYTWKRLESMSSHGALFLQHLKQESIIIRDVGRRLETLLVNYRPRQDYTSDIEATKRVISLTEFTGKEKASLGWAFDVLAVAVRNLGILTLANRGEYIFSYHSLLNRLHQNRVIDCASIDTLQELRGLKHLYRDGLYDRLPNTEMLWKIQRTIGAAFSVDIDSKTLGTDNFLEVVLSKASREVDRYSRFRLLEGAIAVHLATQQPYCQNLRARFSWIVKNQNHYGLFCRDLSKPLTSIAGEVFHGNSTQSVHARYSDNAGTFTRPVMQTLSLSTSNL